MGKKKYTVPQIILLIIIILGFIVFTFGIFTQKVIYCGLSFGAIFFIMGLSSIIQMKSSAKSAMWYVFMFIGLAILAVSCILQFGSENVKQYISMHMMTFLVGGFGVIGVFVIAANLIRSSILKKLCTETVTALCTELDTSVAYNDGRRYTQYAPIFTYNFYGTDYTVKQDYYATGCNFKPGQEYELLINPDKPGEFNYKSEKSNMTVYVIGTGFIIFGVVCLVLLYFAGAL